MTGIKMSQWDHPDRPVEVPVSETSYEACAKDTCELYGREGGHKHRDAMNVTVMPPFDPGPEFWAQYKKAQGRWNQLKEAGTPYWCIHEGRSVTHEAAYWKNDGYFRVDGLTIQYKHGVMCRDCGGYIQEG